LKGEGFMQEINENIQMLKRVVSTMEVCDWPGNENISKIYLGIACQEASRWLEKIKLQVEGLWKLQLSESAESCDFDESLRKEEIEGHEFWPINIIDG